MHAYPESGFERKGLGIRPRGMIIAFVRSLLYRSVNRERIKKWSDVGYLLVDGTYKQGCSFSRTGVHFRKDGLDRELGAG